MSVGQQTTLDEIKGAIVSCFNEQGVTEESLLQISAFRGADAAARKVYVYIAANAGYSNQEIANYLGYKNIDRVSANFNKAIRHLQNGDVEFSRLARNVAKELHHPSLGPI